MSKTKGIEPMRPQTSIHVVLRKTAHRNRRLRVIGTLDSCATTQQAYDLKQKIYQIEKDFLDTFSDENFMGRMSLSPPWGKIHKHGFEVNLLLEIGRKDWQDLDEPPITQEEDDEIVKFFHDRSINVF